MANSRPSAVSARRTGSVGGSVLHSKLIRAAVPVLVLAATFGLAGVPAAGATTTSISTAVDSYVSQRDPDRSYGDGRHIRTCPATCEGAGSAERRVLLQFSVSAIPT